MAVTFNSVSLFGSQFTKVAGPVAGYRAQRSQLPGVNGVRLYRLGKEPRVWTVRGRLIAATAASLESAVIAAGDYINGNLYTFATAAASYTNCRLTSFVEIGRRQTIILPNGSGAATVEVQGTIEQVTP